MADRILSRSGLQELLPVGYPNGDSRRLRAALLNRIQIRGTRIPPRDRRPARRLNKLACGNGATRRSVRFSSFLAAELLSSG